MYKSVPVYIFQLSSIESLCEPPYARDSTLAKRALELLHSAEHTDMVFEILSVQGACNTLFILLQMNRSQFSETNQL